MNKEYASPYRWVGGKAKSAPRVTQRILAAMECTGIRERSAHLLVPFMGGGNVWRRMADHVATSMISDTNADLMQSYISMKLEPTQFVDQLRGLYAAGDTEESYYRTRDAYNRSDENYWLRPALFLYLNRHCYGGVVRYNAKGEYNVPWGNLKKPVLPTDAISRYHEIMNRHRTAIFAKDFREVMYTYCETGTVIYCDPPYTDITQNNTGHTFGRFGWDDHKALVALAEWAVTQKRALVAISNHDTPETRTLYANATELHTLDVIRPVNSDTAKRGAVAELLAIYY